MALEYTLYLSAEFEKVQTLIVEYLSDCIINEESPNDNLKIWYAFEQKGFSRTLVNRSRKIMIEGDLFAFNTHVTFRMSKTFDPLEWRHNMIELVKKVLKEINPGYLLLLFNGETIELMKDGEQLYLDNSDDVDGHPIADELSGVDFVIRKFVAGEVDFIR